MLAIAIAIYVNNKNNNDSLLFFLFFYQMKNINKGNKFSWSMRDHPYRS